MESFLASSAIQTGTVLIVSLTFFVLSTGMLRRTEVKNTITNIWYVVSLFCGICTTFLSSFLLVWLNSSTDNALQPTTGEIVIWFLTTTLCSVQMSSFIVAYILSMYFRFNHTNCEQIVLPLNNENNSSQIYAITFTKKRFIKTLILWLIIEVALWLIGYLLSYIALLN